MLARPGFVASSRQLAERILPRLASLSDIQRLAVAVAAGEQAEALADAPLAFQLFTAAAASANALGSTGFPYPGHVAYVASKLQGLATEPELRSAVLDTWLEAAQALSSAPPVGAPEGSQEILLPDSQQIVARREARYRRDPALRAWRPLWLRAEMKLPDRPADALADLDAALREAHPAAADLAVLRLRKAEALTRLRRSPRSAVAEALEELGRTPEPAAGERGFYIDRHLEVISAARALSQEAVEAWLEAQGERLPANTYPGLALRLVQVELGTPSALADLAANQGSAFWSNPPEWYRSLPSSFYATPLGPPDSDNEGRRLAGFVALYRDAERLMKQLEALPDGTTPETARLVSELAARQRDLLTIFAPETRAHEQARPQGIEALIQRGYEQARRFGEDRVYEAEPVLSAWLRGGAGS